MHYVELVIRIPEEDFKKICANKEDAIIAHDTCRRIANAIPIPKGHGRVVDVGKIDKDRIDHDNPIIYLTINGEYIEAVSLDYISNLTTIIESDKEESEDSSPDSPTNEDMIKDVFPTLSLYRSGRGTWHEPRTTKD